MCRDVSNMNINDEEEVRFLVMYEDLHGLNAWQWMVKCFPTAGLRIVTAPCRSLEIISCTSTYNSLLFCRTIVETFISASEEI